MDKCPNCKKELTQEMIDVNMCWECGFILDKSLVDERNDNVNTINEESDLKKKNQTIFKIIQRKNICCLKS